MKKSSATLRHSQNLAWRPGATYRKVFVVYDNPEWNNLFPNYSRWSSVKSPSCPRFRICGNRRESEEVKYAWAGTDCDTNSASSPTPTCCLVGFWIFSFPVFIGLPECMGVHMQFLMWFCYWGTAVPWPKVPSFYQPASIHEILIIELCFWIRYSFQDVTVQAQTYKSTEKRLET